MVTRVDEHIAESFPKTHRSVLAPLLVVEQSSVESRRRRGGVVYTVVHGTELSSPIGSYRTIAIARRPGNVYRLLLLFACWPFTEGMCNCRASCVCGVLCCVLLSWCDIGSYNTRLFTMSLSCRARRTAALRLVLTRKGA